MFSLLDKLPPANAVLLRQYFQILYEIKSNSPVTEMSSYHLSVGIAPCLLFMPSSWNNGRTKDIAKKVMPSFDKPLQYKRENTIILSIWVILLWWLIVLTLVLFDFVK